MAFIDWNDGYSVHVREIDAQHRLLFDLINRLHDAMKVGKSREVLGGIFSELLRYTVDHFRTEETLLRLHGYPESTAHLREHHELTKQAAALKERFAKGEMITLQVMDFLRDWLTNHILKSDKQYVAHLAARGVK
jgi:hemerythrin